MDFAMRIASHLILKEINDGCNKNSVLSPLSIHIALNMLASGSTGRTLEQLLGFLESDSITHLNAQSSLLMELATRGTHEPVHENPSNRETYSFYQKPSNPFNLFSKNSSSSRLNPFNQNQFPQNPSGFSVNSTLSTTNLVISPLSIHVALDMLASGSTGHTLEHLLRLLELDSITDLNAKSSLLMELATDDIQDPPLDDLVNQNILSLNSPLYSSYANHDGPMICFVNGIWVDKRFRLKRSFKQLAEDVYKANARSVDFLNQGEQVSNEINSWAREVSKGHIDPLLTDPIKGAILVLTNALYFKGTWSDTFDVYNTVDEDFHLLNGETVRVPFMKKFHIYESYGSFEGFKLLKKNYKTGKSDNKRYAMYIFLPDKKDGLQELVEKFNSDPRFLLENRKLQYTKLDELFLPILKYEYELNASESMKELGLDLPFDDKEAEIEEMVETRDQVVYVSKAIQKSFIEVNEKGTIATALNIFEMSDGCSMDYIEPSKISFVADHSFLFMIKEEKSGIVLFVGAALNPLL